jgi:hypothetical protein
MDPCIVDYSIEIPTSCSFVIEFIIPKFIEWSTCFERHTDHHQEIFLGLQPLVYITRECKNSLELLMMSGVPLKTCWAFNKLWNNKLYYKAASCWCFYWGNLYYWPEDDQIRSKHMSLINYIRYTNFCLRLCNSFVVGAYVLLALVQG